MVSNKVIVRFYTKKCITLLLVVIVQVIKKVTLFTMIFTCNLHICIVKLFLPLPNTCNCFMMMMIMIFGCSDYGFILFILRLLKRLVLFTSLMLLLYRQCMNVE